MDARLVVEATETAGGRGRPPLVYVLDPSVEGRWGTVGPYERLSRLLMEIIRTGRPPDEVGRDAAAQFRVAEPSGDVLVDLPAAMARQGFEPEVRDARGGPEVVLHACPFAAIAQTDRDVVCLLHLGIAEGLAEGTDGVVRELVAYDPRSAGCRVRITAPAMRRRSRARCRCGREPRSADRLLGPPGDGSPGLPTPSPLRSRRTFDRSRIRADVEQ